ncbi:MAG TPA: ABC transporter ATP-binding protein [Thermoanaerobaculia bacterium]|nr:ABC transporter ATP-binding protein [Thermoanaerobaculia bacterium]
MIDVTGLTYQYSGAKGPAIRDVSFSVASGEIFGFLGPSGAGKSTTQKILIGLLRDFSGNVAVGGRNVREWRPDDYRRIGVSFELPNHYLKLTALENLRYFAALYGSTSDPRAILDEVGLGDDGERRVAEFSKGMRNRLNVARAILHRPEILFLDEPTTGLDPVTSRLVRDVIRRRRDDGASVFLTTHEMHTADELCDRVAFLVDGQIRLIDSPRALKLSHGRRIVRVETTSGSREDFPLDGLAGNEAFLSALRSGVETIHSQETTLEEVFIAVTGRGLQ